MKKRIICFRKPICFILIALFILPVSFYFNISAQAAEPLDWEAYAASDKYIVEITGAMYYEDNRPQDGYDSFINYHDGSMGGYYAIYRAYDAETGEEIVSQELWFKMEDVGAVLGIIPQGASYPDVYVGNKSSRNSEYISEEYGEAEAYYGYDDPNVADGGSYCRWKLHYKGGVSGFWNSLLQYDENEIYTSTENYLRDVIPDDYYTKSDGYGEIDIHTDNYSIGGSQVVGRYASFMDEGKYSQLGGKYDFHAEQFRGEYRIYRKISNVPFLLFTCAVEYWGELDKEKTDNNNLKYLSGPDDLMDTFHDLRSRIETTVVSDMANAPIKYEWQPPLWNDSYVEETPTEVEYEKEHDAEIESGEDHGVDINQDIVVGQKPSSKPSYNFDNSDDDISLPEAVGVSVIGALTAAGAAGAFGGGGPADSGGQPDKQSKETKEEKKKRYKMYVSKDFGDAIRKGALPVIVSARIKEISTEGGRSRPDLSELISVSGEGLEIGRTGMNGTYMTAEVYSTADNPATKGTVIFSFHGEGGTFNNRVVFRLVGQPYIVYPDSDLTSTDMVLKMISNDDNPYTVRFFFEDAVGEPTKLQLDGGGQFQVVTRPAENYRTYYADVTQMVSAVESTSVYTAPEKAWIGIHAEFESKDVVDGGFYVEIWPEGFSVTSRYIKNDRLMIDTVPNPDAGDLDYVIRPTAFDVRLCYREVSAGGSKPVFLTGEDLNPKFSKLYQVEQYGKTFTDNFRYSINTQFNEYGFEPKDTLPMLKDPYEVMMDISCDEGGRTYSKSLPLGFYGEKPLLPSKADWQAVYKKLKRDIEIFGVGNDPDIKAMLRNARTASASDLEYLRYWIILSGKQFYENQSREYEKIDKVMTNYIVVASSFVKIGDMAVEMAIRIKWPNADAELIAAFVNPWKNAMAEFIGQYVAKFSLIDLAEGEPEDFEFMKTLIASCEATISEVMSDEDMAAQPKTMGKVVSLYLLICFAKHYFYGEGNEKGDIFKSTVEAIKDLTMEKLKSYFQKLLEGIGDLLNKCAEYAGKYLGNTLKYIGFEKAGELAKLAYGHQARMALHNQGELSKAAYDSAKEFGKSVKEQYLNELGKTITEYSDVAYEGFKLGAEYVIVAVINHVSKGTKKENECLGLTTVDVLTELTADRADDLLKLLADVLKERYGIDISKYYHKVEAVMDISVRLDGEFLIMDFCGYTVEINIAENAEALFGICYEACFGWMEDLWKSMQSQDPNWDPRDDLSDDTTMVERMAERVKSLGSSAEIRYTDK